MSLETKLENPWHSSWPLTAGYGEINCAMSKTNRLLVIGLQDSYNSTFSYLFLWFIRTFKQTMPKTYHYPGTRLREKKRNSKRSVRFARRYFSYFTLFFAFFSPIRNLVPGSDYHTFCFRIARRYKTYDVKSSIRSNQSVLKFEKRSSGSRGGARGARPPLFLDQAMSEGRKKTFFEAFPTPFP